MARYQSKPKFAASIQEKFGAYDRHCSTVHVPVNGQAFFCAQEILKILIIIVVFRIEMLTVIG